MNPTDIDPIESLKWAAVHLRENGWAILRPGVWTCGLYPRWDGAGYVHGRRRALSTIVLVAVAMLSGCVQATLHRGWDDTPGAVLTPTVSDGLDPASWKSDVEVAAQTWNAALSRCSDDVFSLGEGGHVVRQYTAEDWPYPNSIGITKIGHPHTIEVVHLDDTSYRQRVIMHELGHAMGLEHTEHAGIMHPGGDPNLFVINREDIIDACNELATH